RLDLNNGISEFLFATGNGKYWIAFSRKDIPAKIDKEVWKAIPLVESSKNFEGACNPNKSAFVVLRPGFPEDPLISAGDAYKCGNNYTFWAMNNYNALQEFKNKNSGVQFFIGQGEPLPTEKQSLPYNPSF